VAGSSEPDNAPSDNVKGGELTEQLNDYRVLKKDLRICSLLGLTP